MPLGRTPGRPAPLLFPAVSWVAVPLVGRASRARTSRHGDAKRLELGRLWRRPSGGAPRMVPGARCAKLLTDNMVPTRIAAREVPPLSCRQHQLRQACGNLRCYTTIEKLTTTWNFAPMLRARHANEALTSRLIPCRHAVGGKLVRVRWTRRRMVELLLAGEPSSCGGEAYPPRDRRVSVRSRSRSSATNFWRTGLSLSGIQTAMTEIEASGSAISRNTTPG